MQIGRFFRVRGIAAVVPFLAAVLGMGGCASLDEKQREWIFQPSDRTWSGGLAAAQGLEDVWIDFRAPDTGREVRLHGLWASQPRPDAPVLLYLHGARWDVRGSAPRIRRMQQMGFAVLGVDYRGFGRSSAGLPSETQAYKTPARPGTGWRASIRNRSVMSSATRWAARSRCIWPAS